MMKWVQDLLISSTCRATSWPFAGRARDSRAALQVLSAPFANDAICVTLLLALLLPNLHSDLGLISQGTEA
jgi:hypothetical protein